MKLKRTRFVRFLRRFHVRKKYKDRLFQKIFEDKKDLLELYNAVNETNYTNPDVLEIAIEKSINKCI